MLKKANSTTLFVRCTPYLTLPPCPPHTYKLTQKWRKCNKTKRNKIHFKYCKNLYNFCQIMLNSSTKLLSSCINPDHILFLYFGVVDRKIYDLTFEYMHCYCTYLWHVETWTDVTHHRIAHIFQPCKANTLIKETISRKALKNGKHVGEIKQNGAVQCT